MSVQHSPEGQQPPRSGLLLLQALILAVFCVFTLRLWYLQVHKGAEFDRLAQENQLRRELLYAPRGLLRDSRGKLLAVNRPAYALALVREDCKDIKATLEQVSSWTGIPLKSIQEKFDRDRRKIKPFQALILAPDISPDLLAVLEANALFWPGLEIVILPKRYYPQGPLMAHILGYVAEANEAEMSKDKTLVLGDTVGKQGLELVLEKRLRGKKGLLQTQVDATGRILKKKNLRLPSSGEHISLSLDLDIQAHAAKQLKGKAGAVVVMDPDSGRLLALVSEPSFDNNSFAGGLTPDEWIALRDDPRHPLQNRAIQSVYPPGSVWKPLMAGVGLRENMIDPEDTIYCPGHYKLGRRVFRCWKKGGHGRVNLRKALVESCDVYFYKLGERLGVDRISKFAKEAGFGGLTHIDLPHEKPGLVPTREWKRKRFNEPWQGGENLNMAIGQGFTLVTPLQVARFISALVNGGTLYKPNLLRDSPAEAQGTLPLNDEQRNLIIEAMVETVEGERGTARRLRRKDARIGGKTGTAQVVKLMAEYEDSETEEIPYKYRDHAWMASFGEKNGKRYVVVALVEHGGHGSSAAGPVVKAMYDFLFDPKRTPPEPKPSAQPQNPVPPQ